MSTNNNNVKNFEAAHCPNSCEFSTCLNKLDSFYSNQSKKFETLNKTTNIESTQKIRLAHTKYDTNSSMKVLK